MSDGQDFTLILPTELSIQIFEWLDLPSLSRIQHRIKMPQRWKLMSRKAYEKQWKSFIPLFYVINEFGHTVPKRQNVFFDRNMSVYQLAVSQSTYERKDFKLFCRACCTDPLILIPQENYQFRKLLMCVQVQISHKTFISDLKENARTKFIDRWKGKAI